MNTNSEARKLTETEARKLTETEVDAVTGGAFGDYSAYSAHAVNVGGAQSNTIAI